VWRIGWRAAVEVAAVPEVAVVGALVAEEAVRVAEAVELVAVGVVQAEAVALCLMC